MVNSPFIREMKKQKTVKIDRGAPSNNYGDETDPLVPSQWLECPSRFTDF